MTSDDKLSAARYYLKRIFQVNPSSDIVFELSSFLSNARSTLYHLLEEYNQKYNLGIPLSDYLDIQRFEKESKDQNKVNAINFIQWYKQELTNIRSVPIGRLFFDERNLDIHKKSISENVCETVLITLDLNRDLKTSISVTNYDKESNITSKETISESKSRINDNVKYYWVFNNHPADNIPDVCTKILTLVENFVNNARTKFP